MNATEPLARRRLWPRSLTGKAAVVLLSGFVLMVVMYFAACYYAAKRLQAAWEVGDESGLPREFQALLGPEVAPEKNMAGPLDRAAVQAFNFLGSQRARWKGVGDPLDDPLTFDALDEVANDPKYNGWLAEADARTEYRSSVEERRPFNSILLPYLHPRRELGRVERAIARRLVDGQRREEAVRRLLLVSRVTRRWEDREPFMIAALTNIIVRLAAMEGLNDALRGSGTLPAGLHDEIEREMAACETVLRLVPYTGQFEKIALMGDYDAISPLAFTPVLRPFVDNDRTYMLDYMHRWAKTSAKAHHEARPELDALDREIREIAGDRVRRFIYIGSVLTVPAVMQMRCRLDRLVAASRCLRVVNAMARRNDFRAPLDSLGLPKECLVDAFDGKALRVKQTPRGPTVYSVDQDFADDDGQIGSATAPGKDVGLGPRVDAVKK